MMLLKVSMGLRIDFVLEKNVGEFVIEKYSLLDSESISSMEDFKGFIARMNSVAPEEERERERVEVC